MIVSENGLRVIDIEGNLMFQIPFIQSEVTRISPCQRYISYRSPNSESIMIYDLDTYSERKLDLGNELFFGGMTWSPDSQQMVITGINKMQPSEEDWSSLYLFQFGSSGVTRITFWPRSEGEPAWSPDGRWIAFASDHHSEVPQPRDMDIYLLNSTCLESPESCANYVRRFTFVSPNGKAYSPSWSPDSSSLAFTCELPSGITICIQDLDTNTLRIVDPSLTDISRPIWSPDGEWIMFTRRGEVGAIRVDGSQVLQLSDQSHHETGVGWILIE
jgi:Tol biopolymer transport system component